MKDLVPFLKAVKPFDILSPDTLPRVAGQLEEITYKKKSVVYLQDYTSMNGLDILASGEYELFFYDSEQKKRMPEVYGPGCCYGGISLLLNKGRSIRTVVAKKETTIYRLPQQAFKLLCEEDAGFFQYFTTEFGKLMLNDEYAHFVKRHNRSPEENYSASDQFYSRRIETIGAREIISCSGHTPIYQAAALMAEHKISCLFVTDEQEQIIGYVTDITLRDNVIARQVDLQQAVVGVIDNPIVSIDSQAFVYEAILLMFRTKTRYILVQEGNGYKGVISRNKLLSEQAQSPFVFIQSVKLALSVEELKSKWEKVPEIVFQLLNRGVKSEIVNQVITSVSDTIAHRVIEWAIEEAGPPPARFVFISLGSEGRKEQTLKTDQDNAIIYEDKANEQRELVRTYFLNFAEKVSEKLNYIGFSFCKGGFMAKNPKWTHSLSHWKRNYESWMSESSQETVMNFSTFFDCRHIYGELSILEELRAFLDKKLQEPLLVKFFYNMATNALQYEPPLTFFKSIKTFTVGEQKVFDIKKTMTPIVDLVRAYALKHRIFKTNTGERLQALRDKGIFTEKEYMELIQAYYYLMAVRLKKQSQQIIEDRTPPENLIDKNSLTKIEDATLREIFKTIEGFQQKIKVEFTNTLF